MNNKTAVTILDCTLRDGSYAIDYQFTSEDTYLVCLGLAKAGFRYIEIGHGTGLGSVRAGKGNSAATDQEYIRSAVLAVKGTPAQVGMFFIPGIGTMEELDMAVAQGIKFIRIGTNVTEVAQALPFIRRAKERGMFVCLNLMKSYALSIDDCVRQVKQMEGAGIDVIAIVDSAGGMLPDDVRTYVQRFLEVTSSAVGFHGHNNLQLAIANTLEAVKAGATVVDASLQGMGRSAGNAQTEVLAMILEKLGYDTGIDVYKTMDLGERVLKPMMNRSQGVDDISLVSGIAQFHSAFFHIIEEVASKHRIDPRRLIIDVSEIERINVSRELAEKVALKIKNVRPAGQEEPGLLSLSRDALKEKKYTGALDQALSLANEITSLSKKTGKQSVFSITLSRSKKTVFPYIRQSSCLVISNVEASGFKEAMDFIGALDGKVDWILLDEGIVCFRKNRAGEKIQRSRFTWYSEQRILRLSVNALLAQRRPQKKVLIMADDENTELMRVSLLQQGIFVVAARGAALKKVKWGSIDAIISFGVKYARGLDREVARKIGAASVYALCSGAYPGSFWAEVVKKGGFVCRIDPRAALESELNLVIGSRQVTLNMGAAMMQGVAIVAGGVIGARGSIVVDSIASPTRVIGVADGQGGLLDKDQEQAFSESKGKVREQLIRNLYAKEY